MKRFRFPLRPVAILRAHREAQAREALGVAVRASLRAAAVLAETRERVAQFESVIEAGRREKFSAAAEARNLASYRGERLAEDGAEKSLHAAQAEVAARRREFAEAHRRVEVVERLEAKARERHRHEVQREEQGQFDELAARRFALRTRTLSP
ncbi:MAG: flagellar FliJ family protein [Opitutaceae bacterium]|nr:flagellar FliJ family protein [Opitutaceae bacterium]